MTKNMDLTPHDEGIVDLREDPLPYPIQCTDEDVGLHNAGPADDFIDLTLDKFPVQCTEPSEPYINIPRCTRTRTDCLDMLLREFHAHVCTQHQQ